jgi:hypothetical protein
MSRIVDRLRSQFSIACPTRRISLILLILAAFSLVGTPAWAYWTTHGSGTGSATTGTVSMSLTLVTSIGLAPGIPVIVAVTVNNTSPSGAVTLTSLQQNGNTTITTSGKGPSCSAGVVTFVAGTLPTTPITAGASASINGTVTMSTAAADDCQGATFSIPLTANGRI